MQWGIKLIKSKRTLLCVMPVVLSIQAQALAERKNEVLSTLTVSTSFASSFGDVSPTQAQVSAGQTASFTITPKPGYIIYDVGGCGGKKSGNVYTTGTISSNCTVSVAFSTNPIRHLVSTTSSYGASLSPGSIMVPEGRNTTIYLNPKPGFKLQSISGCGGTLSGSTYITGFINAPCSVSAVYLAGEKLVYLHTDVLGSAVVETDTSGNVIKRTEYKPFGESKDN